MVMTPQLEVRGVHTFYGSSHILQGISLAVRPGSVVALLGRNGAGKTTLIRSIMGLTPPRRGEILFRGRSLAHLPPERIARLGLGLVPQGHRIFASLTVQENLAVIARGGGTGRWTADAAFRLFPRLRERHAQFAGTLSGGEQQMLAIARSLVANPELLLMDEPSEGLAPQIVREVGRVIGRLKEEGLSTLLVEQHIRSALRVADYVYVMSRGQIVYEGTPADLRARHEVLQQHLGV
jgi:branched-chain amino acid transport system ATP-binding protein